MEFNFTSEEFNVVTKKTCHIMETFSFDEHKSMVLKYPKPSAQMLVLYVFLFLIVEVFGNFLLLSHTVQNGRVILDKLPSTFDT